MHNYTCNYHHPCTYYYTCTRTSGISHHIMHVHASTASPTYTGMCKHSNIIIHVHTCIHWYVLKIHDCTSYVEKYTLLWSLFDHLFDFATWQFHHLVSQKAQKWFLVTIYMYMYLSAKSVPTVGLKNCKSTLATCTVVHVHVCWRPNLIYFS